MASTARWRRTRRAMAHDDATTRTGRFIYANGVARRARATRRRGEGADDATIVADVIGTSRFFGEDRFGCVFGVVCARDAVGFDD